MATGHLGQAGERPDLVGQLAWTSFWWCPALEKWLTQAEFEQSVIELESKATLYYSAFGKGSRGELARLGFEVIQGCK